MDKIKYEIIFKSGEVKNIVSKDFNKVKNYITESLNKISSVKRLDEAVGKSKGYTVVVFEIEKGSDFDFPHEIERFNDIESAKKYATEQLEYYGKGFYAFIYDNIILKKSDIYNYTPIMVAEYKRHKVYFIDWK